MRLAQNINNLVKEPREKKKELLNQPESLDSMIRDGCEWAWKRHKAPLKIIIDAMKL